MLANPDKVNAAKTARRRRAGVVAVADRQPRTHCRLGHPMEGVHRGRPRCLICHREQARKRTWAQGTKPYEPRTHCPRGHELTPENLRKRSGKRRECALCHRLREARRYDAAARAYIAVVVADPCVYCGGPGGTIDHIRPIAKGGTDVWGNLAGACQSCNSRKRTTELLPFLLRKVTV